VDARRPLEIFAGHVFPAVAAGFDLELVPGELNLRGSERNPPRRVFCQGVDKRVNDMQWGARRPSIASPLQWMSCNVVTTSRDGADIRASSDAF